MADINLNEITDLASRQKAGTAGFLAGQEGATQDYLGRLSGVISGQGTTEALAGRIGEELGLPQLQKNAFNLQQNLYDIPQTYGKATLGYDVNQNQLARIVNQKTSEIAPLAQRATEQAQFAEAEQGKRLGYAQNDWVRQLLPYESEESFLKDRLAREASFYSEDNQRELDALTSKMQMGVTLSEGEKNRANALALQEAKFEQLLKTPVAVGTDTLGFYTPKSNSFATGSDWG